MDNIEVFKQDLIKNGNVVGLMTIIRGIFPKDTQESNIKQIMEGVINNYVGHRPHNSFVFVENPCSYVIIEGMDELPFSKDN